MARVPKMTVKSLRGDAAVRAGCTPEATVERSRDDAGGKGAGKARRRTYRVGPFKVPALDQSTFKGASGELARRYREHLRGLSVDRGSVEDVDEVVPTPPKRGGALFRPPSSSSRLSIEHPTLSTRGQRDQPRENSPSGILRQRSTEEEDE